MGGREGCFEGVKIYTHHILMLTTCNIPYIVHSPHHFKTERPHALHAPGVCAGARHSR